MFPDQARPGLMAVQGDRQLAMPGCSQISALEQMAMGLCNVIPATWT